MFLRMITMMNAAWLHSLKNSFQTKLMKKIWTMGCAQMKHKFYLEKSCMQVGCWMASILESIDLNCSLVCHPLYMESIVFAATWEDQTLFSHSGFWVEYIWGFLPTFFVFKLTWCFTLKVVKTAYLKNSCRRQTAANTSSIGLGWEERPYILKLNH